MSREEVRSLQRASLLHVSKATYKVSRNYIALVDPFLTRANLLVSELPPKYFNMIATLDRHHRYNFPVRVGVDIFGEVDAGYLREKVEEWKAEQRALKAAEVSKAAA